MLNIVDKFKNIFPKFSIWHIHYFHVRVLLGVFVNDGHHDIQIISQNRNVYGNIIVRVVDFMGNPWNENTERSHFFILYQLSLQHLWFRYIRYTDDGRPIFARLLFHRIYHDPFQSLGIHKPFAFKISMPALKNGRSNIASFTRAWIFFEYAIAGFIYGTPAVISVVFNGSPVEYLYTEVFAQEQQRLRNAVEDRLKHGFTF